MAVILQPGRAMVLERELRYFEQHLEEWLRVYRGQFVVIKGDELLGSFSTQGEASPPARSATAPRPS